MCKGNIKASGKVPKKEGGSGWDKVKKAYLTKCDGDEPLVGDYTVKRESEITGDERTRERYTCRLTLLEAKFAFLNSQDMNQMKAGDAENDDAMATLDLSEFTECVCRCGRDKYNECKPMSLAERVRGFILNMLGEKGEEAVMRDATYIPAERYDRKPSNPNPNPGPDPDPDPDPDPNPNPDPDPESDPNPDPDSDLNPNPNPDPNLDPSPSSSPSPDPNPNPTQVRLEAL